MEAKKYWFSLRSHVYAEFKSDTMLLYDTHTGMRMEVVAKEAISLVTQMREPENLGVVLFDWEKQKNAEVQSFVRSVTELKMGDLWKYEEGRQKPVRLYPILNLQRDIDRLKDGKGNEFLLGKDVINYLLELNIYLTDVCDKSCKYCADYYKQIRCCTSSNSGEILSIELFEELVEQIKHSPVGKINILGGNILKYNDLKRMFDSLESLKEAVHCYIHYKNYTPDECVNHQRIELIVDFPVDEISFKNAWLKLEKESTNVHFVIENVEQYFEADRLVNDFKIEHLSIHPFFTGDNLGFFEENIFFGKEHILSNTLQMREIFRNQKLNSNFFGILHILPDGSVKANMNAETLGNIKRDTVLDLIYKELIDNTAWRKVRNERPCTDCIYHFICPAPSNYEKAIGRQNLCRIKQIIE